MKLNLKETAKTVGKSLSKHSPEILTGLGVLGMITTTVMAVKATPKALRMIEGEEYDRKEKLTPIETVKVAWKPYVPAAITGVVSAGCIIGASSVNARRQAALVTAYQVTSTALNEYKDKVIETVGEEKAKEIRDKLVEDKESRGNQNGEKQSRMCLPDSTNALFWEPISNQYVRSSKNTIGEAVNYLNGRMIDGQEMYMSFDEFLDELELRPMPVLGSATGWTVERRIDICFELAESDRGEPCWRIEYIQPPEYGYNDYFR